MHQIYLLCFISVLEISFAVDIKSLMTDENESRYNMVPSRPFCRYPGLICKSCSELVKCIEVESGNFEEISIQTCRNDESCLGNHCTNDSNPNCGTGLNINSKNPTKFQLEKNHDDSPEDSDTLLYSYDSTHCKLPGLFCKGCNDLIKCIEIEDGMFKETLIKKCSKDETCILNKCSTNHNPKCASKEKFACTATGSFPDPYDCQIYHVCVKGIDVIVSQDEQSSESPADYHVAIQCRHGFGYNYGTTFCDDSLRENKGFCPPKAPIPACVTLGSAEKLGNTPYYFVCVETRRGKLIPIMHMCPHGGILNQAGKCI